MTDFNKPAAEVSHSEPSFSGDDVDFLNNEHWAAGYEAGRLATPPAPATVESELLRLAVALHGKHYSHVTQWRPLEGDAIGLITQIDNMTAALAAPATDGKGR